jgi:flagellin-like hook-associated protein FlgL
MRITSKMMANNLSYWTSKQLDRFNELETIVAAGKTVNKPSDDPGATAQIMRDRATISAYGQYQSNITRATTWIEACNATLDSAYSLLEDAKSIITALGSESDPDAYIEELESIHNEVLCLANTRIESTYMYGGNDSNTTPFDDSVAVSGGSPSYIVFELSQEASDLAIEITDSAGNVVRTLTASAGVEATNTIAWDGCDDDGAVLADGVYSFTVSALDSSGNEVSAYATYRGGLGGKRYIVGEDSQIVLNNNGGTIFSQALGALSQAVSALKNSDTTDSATDVTEALEEAMNQISLEQVALSNINSQLAIRDSRLDQLASYLQEKTSAREGSTTEAKEKAAVELQAQETAYESAIAAASNALNMSHLADYLK